MKSLQNLTSKNKHGIALAVQRHNLLLLVIIVVYSHSLIFLDLVGNKD